MDGSTFVHANLQGADLRGAFLWATNFTDANLSGALLDRANLTNTIFKRANMVGVSIGLTTMIGTNFTDAIMFEHSEMDGAFAWGVTWYNGTRIDGPDFCS